MPWGDLRTVELALLAALKCLRAPATLGAWLLWNQCSGMLSPNPGQHKLT